MIIYFSNLASQVSFTLEPMPWHVSWKSTTANMPTSSIPRILIEHLMSYGENTHPFPLSMWLCQKQATKTTRKCCPLYWFAILCAGCKKWYEFVACKKNQCVLLFSILPFHATGGLYSMNR